MKWHTAVSLTFNFTIGVLKTKATWQTSKNQHISRQSLVNQVVNYKVTLAINWRSTWHYLHQAKRKFALSSDTVNDWFLSETSSVYYFTIHALVLSLKGPRPFKFTYPSSLGHCAWAKTLSDVLVLEKDTYTAGILVERRSLLPI